MNLNWYCLQYVGVFGPIRKTGRKIPKRGIHVLIIEYIGKKKKKSTCFLTGQGKASLQMEWKENSFVYVEKGGKGIAPFEIPA